MQINSVDGKVSGIKPEIWGRPGWNFLHMVTLAYPENPTLDDKRNYFTYLYTLQYILPCDKCKDNMTKHLKERPLNTWALTNRENLVKWGIDIHNLVNRENGKPIWTYDQALDALDLLINPIQKTNSGISEGFFGGVNNNMKYFAIALFVVILFLIIYYFTKKR